MKASINTALPKCVCASERVKLIGSLDGLFPAFGHHQEREMGGLWLHPVKLLDGFWMKLRDLKADNVDTWMIADGFENRPEGNSFHYGSGLGHTRLSIERRQLAPEGAAGLVVRWLIHNHAAEPGQARLRFLARSGFQPVWFSDTVGLHKGGQDQGCWDEAAGVAILRDQVHPWFAAVAASMKPVAVTLADLPCPQTVSQDGLSLQLDFDLLLPPGETALDIFIAGSFSSEADCLAQLALLRVRDWAEEKEARYQALLSQCRLSGTAPDFCEVFDWVKVNTDWLIQDAGPYGRGLTAGLPEYPWWFGCDNCYALQGVLALGDYRLCRDTLALLLRYSRQHNGNGRILHEVTTGGVCANPGNTQETAHFLLIVHLYYQYSGDLAFLKEAYDYLALSVHWIEAQDTDGDLFPSGYGIIEIAGLKSEMIDSAVYTACAYQCFADISRALGRAEEAAPWAEKAARLRAAINSALWDEEEGLYCDAYTSYAEVLATRHNILGRLSPHREALAQTRLDKLLAQKKALGEETQSGWLINYNWVINTPMEAGIAAPDKAQRALQRMHTPEFLAREGLYLNTAESSAVMTISTGAMAVAQARYGQSDRALDLVSRVLKTFSAATPGCVYEMSPDYGCFVQAWTAYAVMVPVIRYFFGVQPDHFEGRLLIAPRMPFSWTEVSLSAVPLIGGSLDIGYHKQEKGQALTLGGRCALPVWVSIPARESWSINGTSYDAAAEDRLVPLIL